MRRLVYETKLQVKTYASHFVLFIVDLDGFLWYLAQSWAILTGLEPEVKS